MRVFHIVLPPQYAGYPQPPYGAPPCTYPFYTMLLYSEETNIYS